MWYGVVVDVPIATVIIYREVPHALTIFRKGSVQRFFWTMYYVKMLSKKAISLLLIVDSLHNICTIRQLQHVCSSRLLLQVYRLRSRVYLTKSMNSIVLTVSKMSASFFNTSLMTTSLCALLIGKASTVSHRDVNWLHNDYEYLPVRRLSYR